MAEDADKTSKTEQPSAKRLQDARAEGNIPKSPDVAPLLALTATSAVLLIYGGPMTISIMQSLTPFLAHPDEIDVTGDAGPRVILMALQAAAPVAFLLVAAMIAGVVGNVGQSGFLWTTAKLKPDFSKLNPLSGFGRLFGLDGLVQTGKSLVKLIVVAVVAYMIVQPRLASLQNMAGLPVGAILPAALEIIRPLVITILTLLAAIAAVDWFWQRYRFMESLRMTKQEVKQEQKDMDGDPQIKGKRRQIQMGRSRQRMMAQVPKATVVVMNPTHYAVALRYVQGEDAAPVCVAKGLDAVALRIRALAEESGVAVVEDPPLARALYASVEIDQSIPREHFEAVARIIGFILAKAKERARPARARRIGLGGL